jgi:hypothetical protein
MADSPAFDFVCKELEQRSSLDRLEARGTVRIALKNGGLDANGVTPDQMKAVLEKLLPGELSIRGIESAEGLCADLAAGVLTVAAGGGVSEQPDAVFARLGGS